jgi:hypothetical protein
LAAVKGTQEPLARPLTVISINPSGCPWIPREPLSRGGSARTKCQSLKSKNTISQDYEADQKNGRLIASEGIETWHQPQVSPITAQQASADMTAMP